MSKMSTKSSESDSCEPSRGEQSATVDELRARIRKIEAENVRLEQWWKSLSDQCTQYASELESAHKERLAADEMVRAVRADMRSAGEENAQLGQEIAALKNKLKERGEIIEFCGGLMEKLGVRCGLLITALNALQGCVAQAPEDDLAEVLRDLEEFIDKDEEGG